MLKDIVSLALKRKGGARSHITQVPLEVGNDKDVNSPLDPPEDFSPADHLILGLNYRNIR